MRRRLLTLFQKDMFETLDQLIGPLSAHITMQLSQPPTGTDDQRSQLETKKGYLGLLNSIMSAQLQGVFTSERTEFLFLVISRQLIICQGIPGGSRLLLSR